MTDVATILADVRSLAKRGEHHAIVRRYGGLDDTPAEETWNSTDLLFEIGRAFGMLGNEEKVERYLLRCAELAPRRAAVFHCAIGWYFQRKKKWTKALRWYERALSSFPTYHLCLFRRGYCLEKLHRPLETVEALTRARTIWEQAPAEQRQRGKGVQVQVLFHLSRGLRDLGNFDAAAEALDACCELDRGNDPPAIRGEHTLACRAELQLRRGDLDSALSAFQQARDMDPSSSYLWERLGRAYELQGNLDAGEEAYRHASQLPRGGFAYLALGRLYLHGKHDVVAAAQAFAQALHRLRPAEPIVRIEIARLHLACARPAAALQHVDHALACRRDSVFPEGLRLAAELAERMSLIERAISYLHQLSQATPDDDHLTAQLARLTERLPGIVSPAPDPPLPATLAMLDGAILDVPGQDRLVGIVDRFFEDKGFGFLQYDRGRSIFFHVTQCEDGTEGLAPGIRVSFRVGHNPKKGKPQAETLRRLE